MTKYIYLLILIFAFNSCVLRHVDDIEELGSKYYLLLDGRMSTIYYDLAEEGESRKGKEILEPKVVNYNFNENYVVAKTIDAFDKKKVGYWIINKSSLGSEELKPLDSIKFHEELIIRKINLKLK